MGWQDESLMNAKPKHKYTRSAEASQNAEMSGALLRVGPKARGGVRLQDATRKVRSITTNGTVFSDRMTHIVATFAYLPADVQKAARDGGGDEKVKGVFHNGRFR